MPIIEAGPVVETAQAPAPALIDPFRPNVCMTSASMAEDGTITVLTTKGITLSFKHDDGVPTHASMKLAGLEHAFALPLDDALLLATMATLKTMSPSYIPLAYSFPYNVYLDQAQ